MPADPAELVTSGDGADGRPIFDDGVPAEGDAIRENRVIADLHVVRDVGVRHDEVVVADRGHHAAAFRAAVNGNELADPVAMPDAGAGALALVLQILRRDPNGRVGIEHVVLTDGDRPFDEDVRHQASPRSDHGVRADHAVRPDFGSFVDRGGRVNEGRGVDRHQGWAAAGSEESSAGLSASLHITSASATTLPSTVAVPYIFATLAFRLVTFISMRS